MAKTVIYFSKALQHEEKLYDLSAAVGVGGRNLKNDVRLVQTLLDIVFYTYPRAVCPPPSGETGIEVDGLFGPQTHAHIRQFKQIMRANGVPTLPDGKIDAFKGSPYSKPKKQGNAQYVIITLCMTAMRSCREAGYRNDYYLDGPRRIGSFAVNEELRQELQNNTVLELDGYPDGPIPL